jgi:glyoxylase-like metal-dependent hydrolase (beta-lactamase superfamily II)
MAWSTTVVAPPEGSMADYMRSLDRLQDRPERVYWPGHGGPVLDAPPFVAGLKRHRENREAAILAALSGDPRTLDELVAAVYPGLAPALLEAAGLSMRAHLAWLEEKRLAGESREGWTRL